MPYAIRQLLELPFVSVSKWVPGRVPPKPITIKVLQTGI